MGYKPNISHLTRFDGSIEHFETGEHFPASNPPKRSQTCQLLRTQKQPEKNRQRKNKHQGRPHAISVWVNSGNGGTFGYITSPAW